MNAVAQISQSHFPYIVMKVNSQCNLGCTYCHSADLPRNKWSVDLFSRILRDFAPNFAKQRLSHLQLVFHGGEPLLAGIAFYKEILELEADLDITDFLILHGIQTNGTLITEDWIHLFKQGDFRVGLSIDGPAALHNKYRKDKHGKPTFNRVMQSIEMIQEARIPLGLLSVVSEESPQYCQEFFDLLIDWNISSINFLPFIGPSAWKHIHAFSKFTRDFFDMWLSKGAPFHVLTFLEILRKIAGREGSFCQFTEKCGKILAIDTLGRIYPCDRYIGDDRYLIGKASPSRIEVAASPQIILQKKLPPACTRCEVNPICSGGCPALVDPTTGRDIYCLARKALIQHVIRKLHEHDLSPHDILEKFDRRTI